jgi:energy-coupling factor transporter transmembrane protein EcfT
MTILFALMAWAAIGFVTWLCMTYVYFRGPKDSIQWLEMIRERGGKGGPDAKAFDPYHVSLAFAFVFCIAGILSLFIFLRIMIATNRVVKGKNPFTGA